MDGTLKKEVEEARAGALEVLLHNLHGPYEDLPRTAGWGYPEPYTRDMMISSLGMLASGSEELALGVRKVLEALARNQTPLGHIASLAHDPDDLGASDTTPLFLVGLAIYRKASGEADFLEEAAAKALRWMEYQSPDNHVIVAQQPTSDWRDEQWVLGYGLYVNAIVYAYLRLFRLEEGMRGLKRVIHRLDIRVEHGRHVVHEEERDLRQPYYAVWSYKCLGDQRFDLLGNSMAVLSGLMAPTRARHMISWIEEECEAMRRRGDLALDLPPCLFPYIQPGGPDWHPRYEHFNQPGEYHNGGVWPFICSFYVAALIAAGRRSLAERKLHALSRLVRPARQAQVAFGFNEWIRAQDGKPSGQDWQTWSAAMYLYAAACVEKGHALFFEEAGA